MAKKVLMDKLNGKWDEDVCNFFMMIGKKDDKLLSETSTLPPREFARFIVIAFALGCPGMAWRLLAAAEEYGKDAEVMNTVDIIHNDHDTVVGWIEAFISNVKDPFMIQVVNEWWGKKKLKINKDKFDLSMLI